MKEIYSFRVNKFVKRQVEEQTPEGKLTKDVEEEIPVKVVFKKPTRSESEESDIVSAVEYAESVKKGILTKPLLEKYYDDRGGFRIDEQPYEKKYNSLLEEFFAVETEFQTLNFKENKTDEEQAKLKEIVARFVSIQSSIQSIEGARNSLFQNTAEVRARNKTIFWLVLFLTYVQEEEDKEPVPMFAGKTFDEKIADYDKQLEENNLFVFRATQKMSFFVALWHLGSASTTEDFKNIEEKLNPPKEDTEIEAPAQTPEEIVKEVETPKEELPSSELDVKEAPLEKKSEE